MSSPRKSLAALVALAIAAVLFAVAVAPAEARAARKPVPPKIGQCRATTYTQGYAHSDPRKPVPCSQVHRFKTFAVVTIPKRISMKKLNDRQIANFAFAACQPKFWRAVGGTNVQRAQTPFMFWYFVPTKTERDHGARWLRCDISLIGTRANRQGFLPTLPNLPFPMLTNRAITDNIRACLATAKDYYMTPCSYAHVARSDQTFVMPGTKYPTTAQQVLDEADKQCPGKRITFVGEWGWNHGDHLVTCYSITTS